MKSRKTKAAIIGLAGIAFFGASASSCGSPADVSSKNIAEQARQFKVARNIKVINGITGEVVLEVKGLCNKGDNDTRFHITITCKTDAGAKNDIIQVGDNSIVLVEQLDYQNVSDRHYEVNIHPAAVVPDVKVR